MLDLACLPGRKVDLVSKNGLKPLNRASVLEEARLVYARKRCPVLRERVARIIAEGSGAQQA